VAIDLGVGRLPRLVLPATRLFLKQKRQNRLRIDQMAEVIGVVHAVAGQVVETLAFEEFIPKAMITKPGFFAPRCSSTAYHLSLLIAPSSFAVRDLRRLPFRPARG